MKYKLLLSLLAISAFLSCNKHDVRDDGVYVGISKITHYVVLTLKGESLMTIIQGEGFTDPGITATESGSDVQYTTTGSVDANTAGFYTLTYSAVNRDGYSSSTSRTVVVLPAHETPGTDISGNYDYVGTSTFTAEITKLTEGVYATDNCWSGDFIIPCQFICVDGTNIIVPEQSSPYGRLKGTGTIDASGKLVFVISLLDQGIEDSPRTWQKQ
jgi:hypothetical protein